MVDKARVLHQIFNKMILRKTRSKDYVSSVHAFLPVHMLICHKINLPSVMFVNFRRNTSGKGKKTVIPYGALLTKILNSQGVTDLLLAYHGKGKSALSKKNGQVIFGINNTMKMKLSSIQSF